MLPAPSAPAALARKQRMHRRERRENPGLGGSKPLLLLCLMSGHFGKDWQASLERMLVCNSASLFA